MSSRNLFLFNASVRTVIFFIRVYLECSTQNTMSSDFFSVSRCPDHCIGVFSITNRWWIWYQDDFTLFTLKHIVTCFFKYQIALQRKKSYKWNLSNTFVLPNSQKPIICRKWSFVMLQHISIKVSLQIGAFGNPISLQSWSTLDIFDWILYYRP